MKLSFKFVISCNKFELWILADFVNGCC